MGRRPLLAIVLLGLAMTGCKSSSGIVGSGPIVLTPEQQSAFDKWSGGDDGGDPMYFFISHSGGVYYVWCPMTQGLCKSASEEASHRKCERRYGPEGCKLYGRYGRVVWDFDGEKIPYWRYPDGVYKPPMR